MEYTPEIVSKLKTLLEKIQEEENRAIDLCKKLDKQHQKMADANEFSEYYFDCIISVFSFDEDFCEKHDIEVGFYYYSDDCAIFWDDEEGRNMNWLEDYYQFEGNPIFRDLHFCHTACRLFLELSLEDFLAMEKLIFEVRVNYSLPVL